MRVLPGVLVGSVLILLGPLAQLAAAQPVSADSAARLVAAADSLRADRAPEQRRRAVALYRAAADAYGRLDNDGLVAQTLAKLAPLYCARADICFGPGRDSALAYYRQALAIERAADNRLRSAQVLVGMGHVELFVFPDSALVHLRQALSEYRELGERGSAARTLFTIARAYSSPARLRSRDSASPDLAPADSSLKYARQADSLLDPATDLELMADVAGLIGEIFATALGRPDSAVVYHS